MIFVDLNTVIPPESLTSIGGKGDKERAKARKHFNKIKPGKFDFSAYKEKDVKDKLQKLFHGKCAYCETSYISSSPCDIEHFRPKGRIAGIDSHPGYWWFASSWGNLLPSCLDCNRERYHNIYDPFTRLASTTEVLTGKGDSFPIKGTRALKEGDDIKLELPLLINPTLVSPENHLSWVVDKDICVVSPRIDLIGNIDEIGNTSIHIYGLNRPGLVADRMKLLLDLKEIAEDIKSELIEASTSTDPVTINNRIRRARRYFNRLERKAVKNEEYSAMAETFLKFIRAHLIDQYRELMSKL